MERPKYYAHVLRRRSVLAVGPNGKITVHGKVCDWRASTVVKKVNGVPQSFEILLPDPQSPITTKPEMFCDICDSNGQYRETLGFVPDQTGSFVFEVDVSSYPVGVYWLSVFYTKGEDPKNLSKCSFDFYVLSQAEVDKLKQLFP